ncbi:MAG: hypothetical protein IH840_09825 [Candidatus Heimdallarchaeota archaeon]|nr:hypothetical protein [Candidatus Heimdallarchaeota archaeon]
MKEKIYNELRTARKLRSKNTKSDDTTFRDDRRASTHGEHREGISEFTTDEVGEFLLEEGLAKKFFGLVGQGKEANVYWMKDHRNKLLAMKMFRIHTASHNFNSLHSRSHLSDTGKLEIAERLCTKEYENLVWLADHGVRVPHPVMRKEFMYFMEFLGNKRGPSPLLRNVKLDQLGFDPIETLDEILDQLDMMFNKAEMVHGDFSEHNLIFHMEKIYIIDVLQSERYHSKFDTPEKIRKRAALPILKRDIQSILDHFATKYRISYGSDDVFAAIDQSGIDDVMPDIEMSEHFDQKAYEDELKRVEY